MKFVIITLLLINNIAYSVEIGLKPTFLSLGSAEAVNSTASGTEALYYNPAGLAWMEFSLRVIGVEEVGDGESLQQLHEILMLDNPEDSLSLESLFTRLDTDRPIYVRSTARAVDMILPYIGVSTFIDVKATNRNIETEGNTTHNMNFQADVGGIFGLAFRYGKLGFGASYYRMGRAAIKMNPTTDERNSLINAIANETINESTVSFKDFTTFEYGGAEGINVGLQARLNPESYTGIGVSVLNVGGSKFRDDVKFDDPRLDQLEQALLDEVKEYGVTMAKPSDIPQIVNAGVSVGLTDKSSPFHLVFSLDGNDLGGDYLEEKYAVSAKVGLTFPDAIALAASFPFVPLGKESKHFSHLGLLGLYAFCGYRPDAYQSVGATLALHLGVDRRLSLIKFEITGLATSPLSENDLYIEKAGTLLTAGLTWIMH